MALRVQLACWHLLWPGGDVSLYEIGADIYCATCGTRQEITSVGEAPC